MEKIIRINEIFWSHQMEGCHTGTRAFFVRMPHCNLACSFCDEDNDKETQISMSELERYASQESSRFAVITGGEPLMHKHMPVVAEKLKDMKFFIAVETNGTQPLPSTPWFDWITCSPKKMADWYVHEDLRKHVNEYKYVVDEFFDFSILKRHEDDMDSKELWLTPESSKMFEVMPKIYYFIEKNPQWRINLQGHRWLGIK